MRKLPVASLLILLMIGVGALAPSGSSSPLGTGETSLTIYSENLALVNELRLVKLEAGIQELVLRGLPRQLLPETFRLEAAAPGLVRVLEQEFLPGRELSRRALLEKFIGQEIIVRDRSGSYAGKLLAVGKEIILQDRTGQVQIIEEPTGFTLPYLPEVERESRLKLLLSSSIAGEQPLRLAYLTRGLSWEASYTALVDELGGKMSLEGMFTVSNSSGKDYEGVQLRLVAGQPHRVGRGPLPYMPMAKAAEAAPEFVEAPMAEYHLYTLQRPATLRDDQTKRLGFLSAPSVHIEKRYVYERQVRDGVWLEISFLNSKLNGLGQPLPAGVVRFYQRGADAEEIFLGEDRLGHTPVDEQVRLVVGRAFDLVGEWERTEYVKLARDRYRESFQITLRNHKQQEVTIEVIEHLRGDWTITAASHPYEKLDARRIKFTVAVPAGGAVTINYTVEYVE